MTFTTRTKPTTTSWKAAKKKKDEAAAAEELIRGGFRTLAIKRDREARSFDGKNRTATRDDLMYTGNKQALEIARLINLKASVGITDEVRGPVIYTGHLKSLSDRSAPIPTNSELKSSKGTVRHVYVQPYKDAPAALKMLAYALDASDYPNAKAFTLHLSESVIAKARSSGNFAQHVMAELRRHLRRRLDKHGLKPPSMFFTVEVQSKDINQAHLHGVVYLPDEYNTDAKVKEAIRKAIEAGGGADWPTSPYAKGRQIDIRSLWGAAGWARYISKFRLGTIAKLEDANTMSASSDIKGRAGPRYEKARKLSEIIVRL